MPKMNDKGETVYDINEAPPGYKEEVSTSDRVNDFLKEGKDNVRGKVDKIKFKDVSTGAKMIIWIASVVITYIVFKISGKFIRNK